MQISFGREALDRSDPLAGRGHGRNDAGAHGAAFQPNDAGTALAFAASVLRAS